MQCKICGGDTSLAIKAHILNKYDENLYKCVKCGFISYDKVHWLNEAYQEAINLTDTGLVARNLYLYKIVSCIAYFIMDYKANRGGGI